MARSLLIALLSMAAVAGPAAAQTGLADLSPPMLPPEPTLDAFEQSSAAFTCGTWLCSYAASDLACRPFSLSSGNGGWDAAIDPDYCLRDWIDDTIEWPPRSSVGLSGAESATTSGDSGAGTDAADPE